MKLDPTTLVLFLLATAGGAYVLTESTIARPLRIFWATRAKPPFSELVYCAKCSAFWVAIAMLAPLIAGATWVLLPFAAVGAVRIAWGMIESENALVGDAEWLRRSGDDGRRDADAAEPASDRDNGDGKAEGAAEEKAVRDADAPQADGDGEAVVWTHCADDAPCRHIRADGTCGCCCCVGRAFERIDRAREAEFHSLAGCPCDVCTRAPEPQGA